MQHGRLLVFCLKFQLYFTVLCAIVILSGAYVLGAETYDQFVFAAFVASLYGLLVFTSKKCVENKLAIGALLVAAVMILNGITAFRVSATIVELNWQSQLTSAAGQVCVIWLAALTALVCFFDLIGSKKEAAKSTKDQSE